MDSFRLFSVGNLVDDNYNFHNTKEAMDRCFPRVSGKKGIFKKEKIFNSTLTAYRRLRPLQSTSSHD